MKILAMAASNSRKSINRQLAAYAAGQVPGADVEMLDINDYEMPLYSADREAENGFPEEAQAFLARIRDADALVISFAEHNGSFSAAWKNLVDWASRLERAVFQGKPVFFLATSPGAAGAKNVLAAAEASARYFSGQLVASLSVPSFHDNFDAESQRLTHPDLAAQAREFARQLAAATRPVELEEAV